ncbi:hypothetical protein [Mucilaginibacter sp. UR6-11]|uniref:hypothetical protein n=1 Tax=Mucilaginibacter sp. UR6-11 TaxID=1435644 RepID=UPI001E381B49|nr:hypothetical protein [Mucilaginibacter sp. UR6-11]MCC8424088.1 hypothetical protein [Mucilaginibacter sp. UR6-11]
MINYLKAVVLIIFTCLLGYTAKAQIGNDFKQYDLGVGLDMNKPYTDAQTIKSTRSGRFSFNYNVSPFVNYIIDFQTGALQGGDAATTTSGRQFTNSFNAVMFRGQLQMGEIIDYSQSSIANAFKNLYFSTGVGFVVNHITEINRASIQTPGFYTSGEDNSNEILIPARVGYEFKFYNRYSEPGFKIDVGYQYNFIMGDSLDGFTAGKQKDSYAQMSIGIKFAIGGVTSYRKKIAF